MQIVTHLTLNSRIQAQKEHLLTGPFPLFKKKKKSKLNYKERESPRGNRKEACTLHNAIVLELSHTGDHIVDP